MTNHDLALRVETSDAWIVERTGIKERRWVGEGESTATLAIEAGGAAIKRADLSPSDIGCCIVCTCTPEQPIPPTAAFVQDALGLRCGAFDIDAACSGFVYGLVVAASMVASAGFGPVLLIGSETLSRFADPDDRSTCILFGDGAGAVVLVPSDEPALLAWDLDCDGSAAPLLAIPAGGSRQPATVASVAAGDHFLKMDGKEVFRRAVRAMVSSGEATLEKAGIGPTTSPSGSPTRPTPASSTPPPAAWACRPRRSSSTSTATATRRPRRCRSAWPRRPTRAGCTTATW